MADPVVHITNGIPDSGTGNITTLGAVVAALPAALGTGGGLKVDGSGTALPVSGSVSVSGTATVSGSVTANAGTNLNTSSLAVESGGNLAQIVTTLGAVTASPTANTLSDRLKTINSTLGSPFQAGGNIGNTSFSSVQSGVWTVQPGNTPNTVPWLVTINDGTSSAKVAAASTAAVATDKALVVAISPNINGSKTSANSIPVVIASDQGAHPVTQSGTWNVGATGSVAHGSADSGNPVKVGGRARSSEITAVGNDTRADFITDLVGKQITLPYANPENFVSGAITSAMTGTTSTSLVAAPAAGLRNYITTIVVSNSHASVGTDVAIQDGNGGTTLMVIPAAAVYGGAVINLPVPLRQPSLATALFCANLTSGASTKVSAVGYKGA